MEIASIWPAHIWSSGPVLQQDAGNRAASINRVIYNNIRAATHAGAGRLGKSIDRTLPGSIRQKRQSGRTKIEHVHGDQSDIEALA